jgi:hypothetical protein
MSKGSESEQRGDKKQEFESCHLCLLDQAGIKGREAKRARLVQK